MSGRRRIYAPLHQPFVYYRFYPAQAAVHSLNKEVRKLPFTLRKLPFTLSLVMASRGTLPSDPDFLLDFMEDLPEESDSDEEFDGYLEPEDGPIAYRNASELEDEETSNLRCRSRSL